MIKAVKRCVYVVALSIFVVSSYGQEPLELSLEQAIDYALQHNYDLRNAKADAAIASRRVWEVTASGLPQVDGTVGYQYFTHIPTNLVPAEFLAVHRESLPKYSLAQSKTLRLPFR